MIGLYYLRFKVQRFRVQRFIEGFSPPWCDKRILLCQSLKIPITLQRANPFKVRSGPGVSGVR